MTLQIMFNRAWRHFVARRGRRSYDPETVTCLYRGPDGSRCAIGLSIPDRLYKPSMEGKAASEDDVRRLFPGVSGLCELQGCHDAAARGTTERTFAQLVKQNLSEFAVSWKLTIPKGAIK